MSQKHLFLSHAGEDSAAAKDLANRLREAGLKVWLDVDDIRPGDRWMEVIEQVLWQADAFAVYVGRSGVQRWVDREVRVALVRNTIDPNFHIIPILGPGVDPKSIPPFLSQHQWIDLTKEGGEPGDLKRLVGVILNREAENISLLPSDIPPFRGLDVFDVDHAHLFFGRDQEIEELLEKLRISRFLAVVGGSGSGKSSLVRAGLIPALHRGRFRDRYWVGSWRVAILRPGNDPFRELANALCNLTPNLSVAERIDVRAKCAEQLRCGVDGLYNCIASLIPTQTHVLFVIDQFEELFTLMTSAEERRRFVDSILNTVSTIGDYPVSVIISLRADFYSHCFEHPELPRYIAENQYAVRRIDRLRLREVIEKPAAMAGARYQPGLVDVILDDVGDEPGNLPLLEHVLLLLWEKRINETLTHEMYNQIGRLRRALGKRADEVYERFNSQGKRVARRILLHLTQVGDGMEPTRRRVRKDEILSLGDDPAAAQAILKNLVDERLVTTGREAVSEEEVVEVAHEALIRSWQRLREWIEEDRESLRTHRQLTAAVKEWLANDRGDDFLYYGTRLAQTVKWAETHTEELITDEREFLEACIHLVIEKLLSAETSDVLKLVEDIAPLRLWADPLLKRAWDESPTDPREKLHLSLALLPVDSSRVEYLRKRLLDAELKEVLVIRDALWGFRDPLTDLFWRVFDNEEGEYTPSQRFRAAIALAYFIPPEGGQGNSRWPGSNEFLADQIVDNIISNPNLEARLIQALRPIARTIIGPLYKIFLGDEDYTRCWFATRVLAEYAENDIETLAALLMDADSKQFTFLFPLFQDLASNSLNSLMRQILERMSSLPEKQQDWARKRQANAAIALLRMDQADVVWPLLKHSSDPSVRSFIIHRVSPFKVDFRVLLNELIRENDDSIRRALLLCLGEYGDDQLAQGQRQELLPYLLELYRDHADPGIHGAAEWLLRKWKADEKLEAIDLELASGGAVGDRLWYRTRNGGHTMVILPCRPDSFIMGSSPDLELDHRSDEMAHSRRVPSTYALSAKEVTVEQFQQYLDEHPEVSHAYSEKYRPRFGDPQIEVTWYQAVGYCQWLSGKEGVEYRLPTEAEWEYACRANARTSRYYGDAVELLKYYAWYSQNSKDEPGLVGSLKPNDFGLFDILGNLWEWCSDEYSMYAEDENRSSDTVTVLDSHNSRERVIRGGCFISVSGWVRSACRNKYPPSVNSPYVGFRLATTLRP